MNIYGKLAEARKQFHALELKKTGRNPHAGFAYFELGDFVIPAMDCLRDHGLVPVVSYSIEYAVMTVREIDGDGFIEITSPMAAGNYTKRFTDKHGVENELDVNQGANLAGCHPIQNLGAVETYQRRYLWVTLMEIVEHDALDSSVGDTPEEAAPQKPAPKKKEAAPDYSSGEIIDEPSAGAFVDGVSMLAKGLKTNKEIDNLLKANAAKIGVLENEYPTEHGRLKTAITNIREKLGESK